jgi:predicted ATPase with chaperone activity
VTTAVASQPHERQSTLTLHPKAPLTLAETGLGYDVVTQLVLKQLHFESDCTGLDLAERLGLEYSVIEPILHTLKQTHDCSVSGGAIVGGPSYRYRITDAGRRRALLALEQSHYVGAAPVPLARYCEYMNAYRTLARRSISRTSVRQAFSHLVLSDKVIDQLGPAITAGHSMFVYGPPGNGKTVIAQAIHNLMDEEIAIPHAIEVEGQIIKVFDPVNHHALPSVASSSLVNLTERRDARWVRCRRPMVMVGGELGLEGLDLTYSPGMGFYNAPVHMVANGGVLIIDDFGRQRCAPRDLLNRWIVPLESRIDFMTLQTGLKFAVPFMVFVIFATNLKPSSLVDEAFLRRIQYKVLAETPTEEDFHTIFERCCRSREIPYERAVVDRLLADVYRPRRITLRGCQPRDLIDQALALAEYLGAPRELTSELLEAACDSYFVDDEGSVD